MNFPNIVYKGDIRGTLGAADDPYQELAYFITIDDFLDEIVYSKYVKAIEALVRNSDDYKTFIAYIKNTLGIDFCQVFSKIYDKVDATIEFHHGPIFTLYDICEVELSKFLKTGMKANTFRVADSVIDLHFQMKVNGTLLSKTVHEMAHNNDIFFNINQCLGDVNGYIKSHGQYFTPEVKYKLWTYIKLCETNDSFDRGALDLDIVNTSVSPD